MGRKPILNMIGKTSGKLTVIKRGKNTDKGEVFWICECNCENKTITEVSGSKIRNNKVKSCGCQRKKEIKKVNTIHGLSKTGEYNSWYGLIERCYNKSNPNYPNWGGRGITVCDRWKESFENFYKDMGQKPSNEYSIDRIDNDGNYEPDNCKWSTKTEQSRNRNYNKISSLEEADEIRIKYSTKKFSQRKLAEIYKCSQKTINNIVNNKSWTR